MKKLIPIITLAITSKNVSAQSYTILLASTHLLNSNWAYPFRITKQKKIILLSSLLFSYFFSYSQSFEITPSTTTQSMGRYDDIVLKTNATPNIVGMYFGGTSLATPLAVSNNSVLFRLTGEGYNGNTFGTNNVGIEYMTTEHWTPSGNGTKIRFFTTQNGSVNTLTRMTLDHNGFVGIGAFTPNSNLHIAAGSSGVTPNYHPAVFIEDDRNTYLNLAAPDANETGVLFGRPDDTGTSGGIIYRANKDMHLRTNGNVTRMTISSTGNVGIGSTIPAAKLDVNGTVKIGTNGTVLTEVIKHTHGPVSFSINTNASASYSITIPNVVPGSSIVATTSKPLPLGIIQYAHCTTAGLVEIVFFNARNSTSTLTLNDFQIYITVIR